jgi:hypothetical protein
MKFAANRLRLVGLLIALGAFIGLLAWLDKNPIIGWDFRHNLWAPASLLVKGQSPYDIKVLYEAGLALWMPMAIGALFPLGWLSLSHAGNIWFLFNLLAIVIVIWLATNGKKVPPLLLAIVALAMALFPSTITHIRLGQITLIICLFYLLAVLLLDKSRVFLACLLIAFSLVKPQLSILVLPGILISYQREKGTKATAAFIALIVLCTVVLTIPVFLGFPSWPTDFIASIRQNPEYLQPSLFSLLPYWLGDFGYIIWALTAISIFTVNVWLWLSRKREDAIYWSLALTPLVTPYVWSWDFVMVLPLLIRSVFALSRWWKLATLLLAYCLCWILNLYISFRTDVSNHRYWPIPWIILMTIGAVYFSKELLSPMAKGMTSMVNRFNR